MHFQVQVEVREGQWLVFADNFETRNHAEYFVGLWKQRWRCYGDEKGYDPFKVVEIPEPEMTPEEWAKFFGE